MGNAYIDGPFGQLHLRIWESQTQPSASTLICLAPSPFSGAAYATIAPYLARTVRVIALDYPGFGMSAPCPHAPSISDYAAAALALIGHESVSPPVRILGFHTGALVAVEAALPAKHQQAKKTEIARQRIEKLILLDVAYFSPQRQAELSAMNLAQLEITPDLETLEKPWAYTVSNRYRNVGLKRAYALFVDQISAGEGGDAAYKAAFAYPCEAQFSKCDTRATVIATRAGLYAESCAAAGALPNAHLIKRKDVDVSVLEGAAESIAETIIQAL